MSLLVNRDLPALAGAGLIELEGTRKSQGRITAFRLTDAGMRQAEAIWRELEIKAREWFKEVSARDQTVHNKVNAHILAKLRPAWRCLLD